MNKLRVVAFHGTQANGEPIPISLGSLEGHRWFNVQQYPATGAELWLRIREVQAADIVIFAPDTALLESASTDLHDLSKQLTSSQAKLDGLMESGDPTQAAEVHEDLQQAVEKHKELRHTYAAALAQSQPLWGNQHANSIFLQTGNKPRLIIFVIPQEGLPFSIKYYKTEPVFNTPSDRFRELFDLPTLSYGNTNLLQDFPPTLHPNLDHWIEVNPRPFTDSTGLEHRNPINPHEVQARQEDGHILGLQFSHATSNRIVIIPENKYWNGEGGAVAGIVGNFLKETVPDYFSHGWELIEEELKQTALGLIGRAACWQICCIDTYLAARKSSKRKSTTDEVPKTDTTSVTNDSENDNPAIAKDPKKSQSSKSRNGLSPRNGWNHFLLIGTTGTGKEGLAKYSHDVKGRVGKMVSLNCSAITETLAQAELFGWLEGSSSNALKPRNGLIKESGVGTLFLDEFQDLVNAPVLRQSLLRFLQDGTFIQVGSDIEEVSGSRVVAATNELNLLDVTHAMYRSGLLPRFNAKVRVPNLLERWSDVSSIVQHYVTIHEQTAAERLSQAEQESIAKQIMSQLKPADVHREGVRALLAAINAYMQDRQFAIDIETHKKKSQAAIARNGKHAGGRPRNCPDDNVLLERTLNFDSSKAITKERHKNELGYTTAAGLRRRLKEMKPPLDPIELKAHLRRIFPEEWHPKNAAQ